MRTTFYEMRLLNDTSFMNNASFICNGKEWGKSKREGERDTERIKSERRRVAEKGFGVGHKLNCWSSIYEGYRERIN